MRCLAAEEGIEVIHLFSGRPVCQLHLQPGELHADLDGDGVMDHVQVGPRGYGCYCLELSVCCGRSSYVTEQGRAHEEGSKL